jgi:hypothetical protein
MSISDGIKFFFSPGFLAEALTFYGGGKGGSSRPQTQTSTNYTSNVPQWMQPYQIEGIQQAGKEVFQTDASGKVTGVQPYQPYTGDRIAGFTPEELAAQQEIRDMGTPQAFAQGTAGLTAAQQASMFGAGAGLGQALGYSPTSYQGFAVGSPQLQNFQMDAAQTGFNPDLNYFQMDNPFDVNAPQLQNFSMQAAQTGFNPFLNYFQMDNPFDVNAPQLQNFSMQAAQTGFKPELNYFQMDNPFDVNAPQLQNFSMQAAQTGFNPDLNYFQMSDPTQVDSRGFTSLSDSERQAYMNPYQQAVTDQAIRRAEQEAERQRSNFALGAIGRGTFGGAREGLMQAAYAGQVGENIAGLQARGGQEAFMNAQQQFNTDEARRMQAAQFNTQSQMASSQANLQAALGVQQLGTETGLRASLANLDARQQANVQNLASQLQTQGLSADQALRAALANQSTQLSTGQTNLQSALGVQQLDTETGLRSSLANLDARQQANVQNLASQLQTQGLSADQALRAALANQATQLDYSRLNESSQQFGANLGRDLYSTGLSGLLDSSKGLGAMGATQQEADLARLSAQSLAGSQARDLQQQGLDLDYQQAMEARDWNRNQLEWYNNLIQGNVGAGSSTSTSSVPPPSTSSQIAGLGLGALGLYKALG